MITEVDEALRRLLEGAEIGGATVTFDLPNGTGPGTPVVALHLCGVNEETARRSNDWEEVRDAGGQVTERLPRPRWYRLDYEVTTWAKGAAEEHRLLDAVLRRLIAHDAIPAGHLTGSLRELGLTVPLDAAHPRAIAPLEPAATSTRPVLAVTVIAPLRPAVSVPAAPPARSAVLSLGRPGAQAERVATTPGDAALRRDAVAPPPVPTGTRRTPSRR